MGGCATKPKVAKEGDVYAKTPEPQQFNEDTVEAKVVKKQEQSGLNLNVNENEIVHDDDQANKRRSLSLLFKENEDAKVSTENEKTVVDETVKQETSEAEKPLEDAKHNEPTLKHESPKTEEQKLSQETKNNIEPATTKQESAVIVNAEDKSSLQNQSTDSAEKTVKTQTPPEANKLSEETKINEPAEETVEKIDQNTNAGKVTVIMPETKVAEKASSEILVNEPMKQEQSSETTHIEDVVVPLSKEKVIDVVVTNAAESVENKAEEAKSSIEEKSHVGVEHTSKPSDAGSKIL